jgi:hypothetical protein
MSLLPACIVCDALLRGYNGDCLCERCKLPCETCGGDIAHCQHPLRPAEQTILGHTAEQLTEVHGDPFLKARRAA